MAAPSRTLRREADGDFTVSVRIPAAVVAEAVVRLTRIVRERPARAGRRAR